ncbi:unnamed protein product [Caenorhabditis bovis]|uniref:Acid phosphatase n=1 Tax=Caenorhabditis bovis TaxID=2654633 RepID=A0A8S1EKA2_9PELO|nr:unnamed protein product [Caenorhabditis bovis]
MCICDNIPPVRDGEMELKLVQIVWRHGDRSPTETFHTDIFQEDAWKFGGGGFGQLSPLGMKQHVNLGNMLRKRYVNIDNATHKFLPAVYNSKSMYIRSTGINRTLVSAMSNMIGMYGQPAYGNNMGLDYPDDALWPVGFVPIPVHTVDYPSDCIGNIECDCPRREWIWGLAQETEEMQNWINSPEVSSVLSNLTSYINQTYALKDLWTVPDALFIEQIYFNETLRQNTSWFSDDFYTRLVAVNDRVYMYEYGIFDKPAYHGDMNIGVELLKIRAGGLMNEIYDRFVKKSECTYGSKQPDCDTMDPLKYFVYSAHDETVYSVLVAFDIERFAIKPHGYPLYSAAVALEYWKNTTDNADYFKLVYHKEAGSGFDVMTSEIAGCHSDYCSMDILKTVAHKYKPDLPINDWCQVVGSSNFGSTIMPFMIIVALSLEYL